MFNRYNKQCKKRLVVMREKKRKENATKRIDSMTFIIRWIIYEGGGYCLFVFYSKSSILLLNRTYFL